MCYVAGGGDDPEERRHGGHGVGGKHPLLGHRLQHSHSKSGQGRPGVAHAAQQGQLLTWLHVQYLLRVHHLRELNNRVPWKTEQPYFYHARQRQIKIRSSSFWCKNVVTAPFASDSYDPLWSRWWVVLPLHSGTDSTLEHLLPDALFQRCHSNLRVAGNFYMF